MQRNHTTHRCFIPTCGAEISRKHLTCRDHWLQIPQRLRDALINAWKYGLQWHCHPAPSFIEARDEACHYIAQKEANTTA